MIIFRNKNTDLIYSIINAEYPDWNKFLSNHPEIKREDVECIICEDKEMEKIEDKSIETLEDLKKSDVKLETIEERDKRLEVGKIQND